MRKLLITLLAVFFCHFASAQENYAVSAIPRTLLNRASAIVRNSETEIIVNSPDDVTYRYRSAVTVMNSAGDDEADAVIFYDKTRQIKSIKGVVYNEFGIAVGKFAEKDFRDMSAVSDFSLYEDDRVKVFSPAVTTYPYTVVCEYEMKAKQSMFFHPWQPARSEGVAVEKSSLKFTCPQNFVLRHKEYNYTGNVEEGSEKNLKTYKWQAGNIPAMRAEPYSPDPEKYMTVVKLAPEKFAYRGVTGSFSNWNDFGRWMNENLLKGRGTLPQTTKDYIKELVKDTEDPKLKAKKIYEYMQGKTRYVSVQIGIGGYQPYPAADVDRLSYGDCKGLVNYTKALLEVAGIESWYSLVYAGRFKKDISADFTCIDGNHVILCLPFKNDTTWLECTDKQIPFGFLGDFTDDRIVLACTPEGGRLLHTPKYADKENRQVRKASFRLTDSGDLTGEIETQFEGTQYDNHDVLEGEPFKEQVKHLAELYPLPNFEVTDFKFRKEKNSRPVTTENVNFQSRAYASLAGGQMYLSLNPINKEHRVVPDTRNRSNPLFINRGYLDEDEYVFELPAKAKVEFNPGNTVIEKPFGKYSATVTVKDNKVTYHRTMQLNDGLYPKEQYAEFVRFYQDIAMADNNRLILKF